MFEVVTPLSNQSSSVAEVGTPAPSSDTSPKPTVAGEGEQAIPKTLQEDQTKWRLIREGARVYADRSAVADFNRFEAEKQKTLIHRMSVEQRSFITHLRRAEIVDSSDPSGLIKVRYFSAVRNTMYELFVYAADLLPFDAKTEEKSEAATADEKAKSIAHWKERRKLIGKTVRIAPGSFGIWDNDVLWELTKLLNGSQEILQAKMTEWFRKSQAFQIGKDSVGTICSVEGPTPEWVQVDSNVNGQPARFWTLRRFTSDVGGTDGQDENTQKTIAGDSSSSAASKSGAADVSRSVPPSYGRKVAINEEFKLGDYSYKITKVHATNVVGSEFDREQASEGATYIVVSFLIRNDGNKTEETDANDLRLVDAAGRQFSPDSSATTTVSHDFILRELHPGIFKKGVVAFEVPEGVIKAEFSIVIPEKGLFTQNRQTAILAFGPRHPSPSQSPSK